MKKLAVPMDPRVVIAAACLVTGCRQAPLTKYDLPNGIDDTFVAEERDDTVPIEKELAAPKGFFNRKSGSTAGWSSDAREIERSLGVGR